MAGGPIAAGPAIGHSGSRNKWAGIFMTAFAAFGGILFGYDTGVISGIKVMPDWLMTFGHYNGVDYELSTSMEALVVGILSAGTFVGALLAAPVADSVGRKLGIILACVVFAFGVALQTAATTIALFVVGRVFAGLGVGIVSCIVPMYQSECAPKWIRGAVVSCYQWAITIGLLLASLINNATEDRRGHSSWRIPVAIQFVWAAVLACGIATLPESPRWLLKKGRQADAAIALGRLIGASPRDPVVGEELDMIQAYMAENELNQSYSDCFRPTSNRILFRTVTGMAIMAGQQLTGINFIYYYGTTFFQRSGVSDPFLISVITNVVNVVFTIPGIWLVDRAGRRSLLLIGAAGMLTCQYIVAIVGISVKSTDMAGQSVLIAFVCIYIVFFASSWGPVPWVVTGEIYPLSVRAKAMSMSTASNWLWNTAIGFATPYLVDAGHGNADLGVKVFFLWGTTCAGCLVFTYFCIPETKGLSLEAIDMLYQETTPPQSVAYRNKLMAEEETTKLGDEKGDSSDYSGGKPDIEYVENY